MLLATHDDVIKWKHFPRNYPFVRGIHRSPVNSPHKGQWRGALMFSLICVWINDWVNNHAAGDLRRYRAHYNVIVMTFNKWDTYHCRPYAFERQLACYEIHSNVLCKGHKLNIYWSYSYASVCKVVVPFCGIYLRSFAATLLWGGWDCEVSCGGHHRLRGKTTTGSALDGAVFDIAQLLAYLVHNMSRSQLHLGFGHFGSLPSFFGQ